jgi:large repetitive protein
MVVFFYETSNLVMGADYAMEKNASIINFSTFSIAFSQALFDMCSKIEERGKLLIAIAGNTNYDIDSPFTSPNLYPAEWDFENMIVVAASDQSDLRSIWTAGAGSCWGTESVDLAAPGSNIRGFLATAGDLTLTNGTILPRYWDGTSFAAPIVAGAAAMVWAQNPNWNASQVKNRILCSTRPVGSWTGLTVTRGILDLNQALTGCRP